MKTFLFALTLLAAPCLALTAAAPAADECTVVRRIPVYYLSIEALTTALGGSCVTLFTAGGVTGSAPAKDGNANAF